MNGLETGGVIRDLNERATAYHRQGLSIDDAIQQAVKDYIHRLKGVGYKILSEEEIERNHYGKWFEAR